MTNIIHAQKDEKIGLYEGLLYQYNQSAYKI